MQPVDVLAQWFDAHSRGDLELARSLIAGDAAILVLGRTLHGFDEFMEWYEQRLATEPTFSYDLMDLMGGENHAAALLVLRSGSRSWRQMALFAVRNGLIRSIWAVEEGNH